ncbi:MAG: mechanosensitive ion channel domain-containing protein, partial [Alphaproteobacteria bacterium]
GDDGFALILKLVGLVLAAMLVVLVLQNRAALAGVIRGGAETEPAGERSLRVLRARLADVWHILAIVYIVGVYLVAILQTENGVRYLLRATILTLVILAVAWLLAATLRRVVARGFALGDEAKTRFPKLEARANRYFPVLQTVLRGVIYVVALLSLMEAWGIDAYGWFATESGARALRAVATILFVALLAVLIWEITSSAIERQLDRLARKENRMGSARLATLLPLIRQAIFFVLATVVAMIALSELGVNIGPLLAAAGVVGLAIGFGAQTLVKDVITGLFILLENQIRVGDVVNLGGNSGLVESMSIRTIRLRDLTGTVHIIPFSEVGKVLNLTKEFSYYLMEIGVAYREDTDQVVEVCRGILDEMRDDPAYGRSILEPLDVLGVDRFDESAVIVRARIKTRPIKQWEVGREFNRRMKKKFDELGIEIPFPHRTIYFGVDKDGTAPPAPVELTREKGTRQDD